MLDFRQAMLRIKYGQPVIVVSGLPRSGTSMLMNMLHAGGVAVHADHQREPDVDNPKGYFEHERVKNLEQDKDRTWVREARGKAIKVISHLLPYLPGENRYRIVLAVRDLREILASQNKMLARLGKANPVDDDKALILYERHLRSIRSLASVRGNFDMVEVPYADVIADPALWSAKLGSFVGGQLDCRAMADVVEADLYRNRVLAN